MLVLKSIGLTILFAIIMFFVAELIVSAILLAVVYPYSLGYMAAFLQNKGRGCFETPNRKAQGFNILIRLLGNGVVYLVGLILIAILVPFGAIWTGCILGWVLSGILAYFYEASSIPIIGKMDRVEYDSEKGANVAVFRSLDRVDHKFSLEGWELEDYPIKDDFYAVMNMANYWAFMPLRID